MSKKLLIALLVLWALVVGLLAALSEGFIPKTLRQVLLAVFVIGPLLVFGEALLEGVLQIVSYCLAKVALPALSFGLLRVEALDESHSFPWYGIVRNKEGKFVASAEAGAVLGLVLVVAVIAVVSMIFYAT